MRAGIRGASFLGGEGFFFATMRGPGKVWIQILPFSRLAAETVAAAPSASAPSRRHSNDVDVIGSIQSLGKLF